MSALLYSCYWSCIFVFILYFYFLIIFLMYSLFFYLFMKPLLCRILNLLSQHCCTVYICSTYTQYCNNNSSRSIYSVLVRQYRHFFISCKMYNIIICRGKCVLYLSTVPNRQLESLLSHFKFYHILASMQTRI